jgi:hypothetical protein
MTDWKEYEAKHKTELQAASDKIKAAALALGKLGCVQIVAAFSGSGDEGWVNEVHYIADLKTMAELEEKDIPAEHKLGENAFYPLLPAGFEINEGSSGTVTVDCKSGRAQVSTDWNQITTTNESYEV